MTLSNQPRKFNIKQNQCRFCELKLVWDWQHLAWTTWTYIQSQFSGSAFNDLNKPINKLPVKLHANRTNTSLTITEGLNFQTDNIWCHQLLAACPEQINKTKCLLQTEPVQTANEWLRPTTNVQPTNNTWQKTVKKKGLTLDFWQAKNRLLLNLTLQLTAV